MKNSMEKISNRLRSLYSDTRGQSMVLVALSLVVLLGFGALATDVGYLYVQRRDAQNLADAASLAGTWYIGNKNTSVEDIAKDYAELHGYSREDIEAEVVDKRYVEAFVTKEHDLFFARVLGFESSTITARAKATRTAIWSLDTMPFAFQDWENLFYKIVEDDLANGENFYDLFNPPTTHELYDEFNMRPGILEDDIRDLLLTSEITSKLEVGQQSVIYVKQGSTDFYDPYLVPDYVPEEDDKYPSWELELLLQNNLSVYKKAFDKIAIEPNLNSDDSDDYEIDILFGKNGSITGNFGYAVPEKRGASAVAEILTNGFDDEIGSVDGEPGAIQNIAAEGGPLDLYIKRSEGFGFMYATLPKALKGGRWTALGPNLDGNLTEYLILLVYDLELNFNSDDTARLTGKVKESYTNINDIDKNPLTVEMYQSYLVKFE